MTDADGAPPCFVPLVNGDDFVYIGGVKIARVIPERGTLQFWDKDTRRATRRGCPVVEVRIERLLDLLH